MRLSLDRATGLFVALLAAEAAWIALPGLPDLENSSWGGTALVLLLLWLGWAHRSRGALTALAALLGLVLLTGCLAALVAEDLASLLVGLSLVGFSAAELGSVLLARFSLSGPISARTAPRAGAASATTG